MNYLVMLGSDMFYGTSGVLTVQIENKVVDFFRIREIYRIRSAGSYLAVNCDIKDKENEREVKLFKSKSVAQNEGVEVFRDLKQTIVTRPDGSIIIKVEQLELNNIPLLEFDPIKKLLSNYPAMAIDRIKKELELITIDAVIKITGDFYAGEHHLIIDNDHAKINGITISGNLMVGTGGIKLVNNSFSLG